MSPYTISLIYNVILKNLFYFNNNIMALLFIIFHNARFIFLIRWIRLNGVVRVFRMGRPRNSATLSSHQETFCVLIYYIIYVAIIRLWRCQCVTDKIPYQNSIPTTGLQWNPGRCLKFDSSYSAGAVVVIYHSYHHPGTNVYSRL